jgi:hypothetical protein
VVGSLAATKHLYPQLTAKGIERTVRFYKERYGKDITDDERERTAQVEAEMAAQEDRRNRRTGSRRTLRRVRRAQRNERSALIRVAGVGTRMNAAG